MDISFTEGGLGPVQTQTFKDRDGRTSGLFAEL